MRLADLHARRWIRLPPDTDPVYAAYWTVAPSEGDGDHGTPVRTIQECLHAVLWNGMSALAPVDQVTPAGPVVVPVDDRLPSRLVLAWPSSNPSPLVRSFVRVAADVFRRGAGTGV